MHSQILRIALPSIVSNITVPLLALADTTIVGHLGSASYIGAIALGGMLFNMAYWLFGFLRMGTGGLTAQAYGAGQNTERMRILLRSLSTALFFSTLLIVLQKPIVNVAFILLTATPQVELLARTYFSILIWGAPAVLGLYSFSGWFLGMQNARFPMYIAIVQNLTNISISLILVYGFSMKVEGVAIGTLIAQYTGLFMALWLGQSQYKIFHIKSCALQGTFSRAAFGRFFRVNSDIFLRTLCLIAVSTYFTSAGSAQGELTLAANTLLMQFFILFSYIMDGFAYAGEALGGKCYGAHNSSQFCLLSKQLFMWGGALTLIFTLIYLLGGSQILHILTNEQQVINTALVYMPYAVAIPVISCAAFLFDGLFIGTTSTRYMLWSMAGAALTFFCLNNFLSPSNASLWIAFLAYLGGRGALQALFYPKVARQIKAYSK